MDEGWAAIVSAAAGLIGAALGAVGGYLGGRAQARGTIEGVRLQLSGQRADALWQAEVDACAAFVDVCNRAMFKASQVVAIADFSPEQVERLRIYGVSSRDQLLTDLTSLEDECILRRAALLLRVPSPLAEEAADVGTALAEAAQGIYRWCGALSGDRVDDAAEWQQEALMRVAMYAQILRKFSTDAQKRYSSCQPTT
jgi:hypothetical protein